MKKLLITGGSKGLGKEIVKKLQNEYEPGFGGHSEQKYIIRDVSRTTGYDLTKEIPEFDCDILILNAGIWKNDWRLNYEVPKEMAERAAKGTLVVFILSNAAYQSFGNDDYTAAKSGLLHYVRRKQREGFPFITISPGTINTNFWEAADVDHRKKGCMKPEVVAELVVQAIKAYENKALIRELIVIPI